MWLAVTGQKPANKQLKVKEPDMDVDGAERATWEQARQRASEPKAGRHDGGRGRYRDVIPWRGKDGFTSPPPAQPLPLCLVIHFTAGSPRPPLSPKP